MCDVLLVARGFAVPSTRCFVAVSRVSYTVADGRFTHTGFIGRNLVKYLVDNNLASTIRVLDKVLAVTAFMSAEHRAAFEDPRVQCRQANLSAPASIKKNFDPEGGTWDVVFNLAAETK